MLIIGCHSFGWHFFCAYLCAFLLLALFAVNQFMHIQIKQDTGNSPLYPFTRLRTAATLRTGIFTLQERCALLGIMLYTENEHAPKTGGSVIELPENALLSFSGLEHILKTGSLSDTGEHFRELKHASDLVKYNDWALHSDFEWLRASKPSMPVPETVQVINPRNVFIEPGAKLHHCIINAANGPVYIGANAEIMEGSMLRGPLAIGEGAVVKMGAKIYGATTIGPYCIAGGEIKNSILMGFSNKAHDGYLGDAVLGEWCNLGAGTSNSNIKNTAGEIQLYSEGDEPFAAGNKFGLIMGDFSRSAINTSFNTGTIAGACCNIFGAGLTPKHIPAFSWGLNGERYREEEALRDINNWMALKGKTISPGQEQNIRNYYRETVNKSTS